MRGSFGRDVPHVVVERTSEEGSGHGRVSLGQSVQERIVVVGPLQAWAQGHPSQRLLKA